MRDFDEIHREQNRSMDALIAAFEHHVRDIVTRAQARVAGYLQKKLRIEEGVILSTPGNNRVLRGLDAVFVQEMDKLGYGSLVRAFVGEFPGHLPYMQETLEYLSAQMKTPLPAYKPTAADRESLAGLQANTAAGLDMVIKGAASSAVRSVMLSVGGLKFSDLVEALAEKFTASVAKATTLADTAMATFFRTATARAFETIQADLPELVLKYKYTTGPDDRRTRPFCHRMIAATLAGKRWTREQIDAMDNRNTPVGSAFVMCGGWACRHSWLLSTN